jgi:subtilisin family serine protease
LFSPVATRWTGEGEVVAVFDSGVDETHKDLVGRLAVATNVDGATAEDRFGHGTHVIGIIVGTGALSDGEICGMAPMAQVASIGVVNDSGELVLPINLGSLLARALDYGAKIINLSWGKQFKGEYQTGAASIDAFVHQNPEVLVVVAAGNSGTALEGEHPFRSIFMPASAKNVLTVGASASRRKTFPDTWGSFRQSQFPVPPVSDLIVAGDPDVPAAISSRGPTDFRTVKPELLAPGTFILAPRAKGATMRFDKPVMKPSLSEHYGYCTGTSMAAPVVAGAAALLREQLRIARGCPNPSAALLKALLIAAARPARTTRNPERAATIGYPDFDQGFGILELRPLLADLESDTAPNPWRYHFIDVPNNSEGALQAHSPIGGSRRSQRSYRFRVEEDSAQHLRVVLAWTEPPGRGVQNALALVLRSANATNMVGNQRHLAFRESWRLEADAHETDRDNNVQEITVEKPEKGNYRITITATDTATPPQGYALALLGAGVSSLEPIL